MKINRLFSLVSILTMLSVSQINAQLLSNYAPVATGLNSLNSGERNSIIRLGIPFGLLGQLVINGNDNVFTGYNSGGVLNVTATGNSNSFYGSQTGANNTTGLENTFIGAYAGFKSNAQANTFIGARAGYNNSTGNFNTFIGTQAGYNNTTGASNFMMGTNAGQANTTGLGNFFLGDNAAGFNTSGSFNVYLGANVANGTGVNGDNNTSIGFESGRGNSGGVNNTFIGFRADAAASNLSNATAIGNNARVTASNALILGGTAASAVNVGIGTTAPQNRLEITYGTANQSGLRLTNLTSSSPASVLNQTKFLTVNANGDVVLGSANGSARIAADLWKVDGNRLQNTNAGSVIIGNEISQTPTGYKLFVEGGILTEKVKVAVKNSSDWSDYVFATNYKLRSLNEVEKFVKRNKHLPGVPSAQEIVKEGVDMAKMDAKLLEKVEELTLYMIQMKKENDRRINQLEKENSQLKQLIRRNK